MVFEAASGAGHAFNYHRSLLPAIASLTDDVVFVFGRGELESRSAEIQLRDVPATVQRDASVPPLTGSQLRRQWTVRHALKEALARHRPDHVYVPTADSISQVMGLATAMGRRDIPRGVETEAALHRCGFAYPATSLRKTLFYRTGFYAHALAPWTRLFNVDLVAYEWIQRRGGNLAKRNFLLPDPVDDHPQIDRVAARRRLGIPEEGPWIGCVGILNSRKGVDLLLAAFREAKLSSSARLLLAGQHDELIRNLLATDYAELVRKGRVVSLDRYLEISELYDAIAALDVVCPPYNRQMAISSIVLRAAAAGRPVLTTDDGWCGRIVPQFKLGWMCDVRDVQQFAHAMERCLEQSQLWQPSESSRALLQFHTPKNFAAVFTARLRERLGLPPAPGTLSWEDAARASRPGRQ
jgi:glycosyltransferase involved in cell wall biosynthesis